MKYAKINNFGFTVVELLVVIGSMTLILISTTVFLLSTLSSSGKAEAVKEIRHNGDMVLTTIRSLLTNSNQMSGCLADDPSDPYVIGLYKQLSYSNSNGNGLIQCDINPAEPNYDSHWASNSAELRLTDSGVDVIRCYIYCLQKPGSSPLVKVGFTLGVRGQSVLPEKERVTQDFSTVIYPFGAQ